MQTRVRFGDDELELSEQAATAFAGYSTPDGWSVRVALGALLDGRLQRDQMAGTYDLERGLVAAVGLARHWALGDGQWFITGSAGISVAATSTHELGATDDPSFVAGDGRVGMIAGRSFAKTWNPYLLARGFGGPIWWTLDGRDATGSDTHHFQLGAGVSVVTSIGLTFVVDISAFGEQSASLGASWRL